MRYKMQSIAMMIGALLTGLMLSGCPPAGEARAVILLSGDASGKALVGALLGDKADVDVDTIDRFLVTVTEISLDGAGGSVVAFSGTTEVDLLDLTGVSQLITDAAVPAGTYTKIRLSIENTRMYLLAEPDTEITDINLTANGRLFVSQTFEIPEGQTSLILLDFNGLKLVQQGNGGYTLTPQLQVDLSITDAAVTATGEIVENGTAAQTLRVNLGTSEAAVDYSGAAIYLEPDTETPTGTPADLVVGINIRVEGLLRADGSIDASVVEIVPAT